MDLSKVDYLAVLGAAVSSFLIGGLWYSPILFARAWMREAAVSEDRLKDDVGSVFAGAFVLSCAVALTLALFLGPGVGVARGAGYGGLAGAGLAAASLAIVFAFERRSITLIVIDGGYLAVAFTAMGAIIGALQ